MKTLSQRRTALFPYLRFPFTRMRIKGGKLAKNLEAVEKDFAKRLQKFNKSLVGRLDAYTKEIASIRGHSFTDANDLMQRTQYLQQQIEKYTVILGTAHSKLQILREIVNKFNATFDALPTEKKLSERHIDIIKQAISWESFQDSGENLRRLYYKLRYIGSSIEKFNRDMIDFKNEDIESLIKQYRELIKLGLQNLSHYSTRSYTTDRSKIRKGFLAEYFDPEVGILGEEALSQSLKSAQADINNAIEIYQVAKDEIFGTKETIPKERIEVPTQTTTEVTPEIGVEYSQPLDIEGTKIDEFSRILFQDQMTPWMLEHNAWPYKQQFMIKKTVKEAWHKFTGAHLAPPQVDFIWNKLVELAKEYEQRLPEAARPGKQKRIHKQPLSQLDVSIEASYKLSSRT